MERAEREFCDCSQRVCSARLFASEIILKITEDHFINLVEIWSKATKHGPLSLKLQKGAFWQLWQRMHFYLHDVLCLNGLSHLPAGVSNSISPRATMEKWQSHPDPNTSGFNSFTCHTQQKSDQTVNRKSETLTQLTCRPHVCLKSGMSNQLPTLALSGSICKDIYLHIESFSYLHIYKAKCRLNTMSQLFSRW